MNFPLHVPDNSPEAKLIESIVTQDHVSPAEAVLRALRGLASEHPPVGVPTKKRKPAKVAPLSDEELGQLQSFGKTFGLLADVPDEEIDRMAAAIQRMKRERFAKRG